MKWKIAIVSIIFIPILVISILFIQFERLPVYTYKGENLFYNHLTFKEDTDLFKKYVDGNLQTDGIIGKTADSKFFGFKTTVFKAKGFEKNDVVIIQGLMFDSVLKRQKD